MVGIVRHFVEGDEERHSTLSLPPPQATGGAALL
jgi:hypothetical protein